MWYPYAHALPSPCLTIKLGALPLCHIRSIDGYSSPDAIRWNKRPLYGPNAIGTEWFVSYREYQVEPASQGCERDRAGNGGKKIFYVVRCVFFPSFFSSFYLSFALWPLQTIDYYYQSASMYRKTAGMWSWWWPVYHHILSLAIVYIIYVKISDLARLHWAEMKKWNHLPHAVCEWNLNSVLVRHISKWYMAGLASQ